MKNGERKFTKRAHPRRVDFSGNGSDFLAAVLAAAGLETQAIARQTGLTISQVMYRLVKVEMEAKTKANIQGREHLSARKMYRKGLSPISRMIIGNVTGKNSKVKKAVGNILHQRGLMDSAS